MSITGHTKTVEKPLLGVFLTHANELLGSDLRYLGDSARCLEDAGIDYVVVADHLILGTNLDGHGALGGKLPFPQDEPYPEPLVTLAAVAAVTTRMRLATGIVIAPLRPAVLLAKMAATVDVLSGGRLDLGLGTGWQQEEYDALGVPMEEKVRRLDDTIDACQLLWGETTASFRSATVSFENVACAPRPLSGSVPLWFAGTSNPSTLRRVARSGAGWLPLRLPTPDELRDVSARLAAYGREFDREDSDIGIRVTLPTVRDELGKANLVETTKNVTELYDLGVTGVQVNIRDFASSLEELADVANELRGLV
jgi:probable F420-dependent oxidoreductase